MNNLNIAELMNASGNQQKAVTASRNKGQSDLGRGKTPENTHIKGRTNNQATGIVLNTTTSHIAESGSAQKTITRIKQQLGYGETGNRK